MGWTLQGHLAPHLSPQMAVLEWPQPGVGQPFVYILSPWALRAGAWRMDPALNRPHGSWDGQLYCRRGFYGQSQYGAQVSAFSCGQMAAGWAGAAGAVMQV